MPAQFELKLLYYTSTFSSEKKRPPTVNQHPRSTSKSGVEEWLNALNLNLNLSLRTKNKPKILEIIF